MVDGFMQILEAWLQTMMQQVATYQTVLTQTLNIQMQMVADWLRNWRG